MSFSGKYHIFFDHAIQYLALSLLAVFFLMTNPLNLIKLPSPENAEKVPLAPTRSRTRRQNKSKNNKWTDEEDKVLFNLVSKQDDPKWTEIVQFFPDKTYHQIVDRWAKVLNPNLVKGSWTGEEDALIMKWVTEHGPKDWGTLAEKLPGRISKQCRERWHNHLSPNVLKSNWSEQEDQILIEKQKLWGNKWARIAMFLPGRTDNAVKNRWNSSLKRRLERIEKGQDPSGKRGRKPKRPSEAPSFLDEMPKPNIDEMPIEENGTLNSVPSIQMSPTLPSPLTPTKMPFPFIFSPGWTPTQNPTPWNIFSPFPNGPGGSEPHFDKNDLANIPGPKID
ncbi:Myb-like DNA-binding domain containing protein [Tritrichomonas foetus]|uniref:Myb-like DNA-binding domain containing protein n=1 Tax=Tritrichomonas foetus TaxID=1144522 RepID=A0A1J4JW92_9EUKA|nr:Myb-like DNA-binding domain containing protein [Tritrichomonas foetus]|eukprot:OHT03409.1 Myb-like DNA-binding domain containing protein [Tritrichomonas foetus]